MDNQTPKTTEYKVGKGKPPIDKQFGQPNGNPINPHGSWKKEDTPRFKLEQMMKLTEAELKEIITDPNAPYFEKKLATCINKGRWKEIEGMMNQVYGFPKMVTDNKHTFEKVDEETLKKMAKAVLS
jgi:hypothetical protein